MTMTTDCMCTGNCRRAIVMAFFVIAIVVDVAVAVVVNEPESESLDSFKFQIGFIWFENAADFVAVVDPKQVDVEKIKEK